MLSLSFPEVEGGWKRGNYLGSALSCYRSQPAHLPVVPRGYEMSQAMAVSQPLQGRSCRWNLNYLVSHQGREGDDGIAVIVASCQAPCYYKEIAPVPKGLSLKSTGENVHVLE